MLVKPITNKFIMKQFLEKYKNNIYGSINGWDRLAFRGTIRWLSSIRGVITYLSTNNILYKDFGKWVEGITGQIRSSCEDVSKELGIERHYLRSSSIRKEDFAKEIMNRNKIKEGPVCMLSVVEPSYSPSIVGNKESKKLEVQMRPRRCIWVYFYFNDPDWGLGHFRLQTWLPFTIKGCLNGREWLARKMDKECVKYRKSDNCFRWIEDIGKAQELFKELDTISWDEKLNNMTKPYFGVMRDVFESFPLDYYWSVDESEWATDVMFRNSEHLDRLFPLFTRYGVDVADSANVLRFLGVIDKNAPLPAKLAGEARTDRRRRYEGVRIKHWYNSNSVKAYNKAGNVLRVETTINNPRGFKVYRINDNSKDLGSWQPMRKGVSDLHRRSQISQKANERYYECLSACNSEMTLKECVEDVCKRVTLKDKSIRALNPWRSEDYSLIEFLACGEWNINGFKNKDLQSGLPELKKCSLTKKQKSSKATRLIRMLRAHGLIRKVPKSNRYTITPKGRTLTSLVKMASPVQTHEFIKKAA